jgi:hypothetical protein
MFIPVYRRVPCAAARVLEKTPKFPEKFPGISGIPENPRKIFSEIPGNSVRQVFPENFPDFPNFSERSYTPVQNGCTITRGKHLKLMYNDVFLVG